MYISQVCKYVHVHVHVRRSNRFFEISVQISIFMLVQARRSNRFSEISVQTSISIFFMLDVQIDFRIFQRKLRFPFFFQVPILEKCGSCSVRVRIGMDGL